MFSSIKIFARKVNNRISLYKRNIYRFLPLSHVSLIGIKPIRGKLELTKRLSSVLGGNLYELVQSVTSTEKEIILNSANESLGHIYDVLGTRVSFSNSLCWLRDFKTEYEWPLAFYTTLRSKTPLGVDIKCPWEFSRCHHLLWLGEAYIITQKEEYAKEVIDNINDWIDKNPLMYTVNWTCAMDVSIRAINWMYALMFIKDSKYLDDHFAVKVYESLYQHAFFISVNQESQIPYSNNHYVSDIVGLLYLGCFFDSCFRGRQWKKYALKEFYKEIRAQILSSGVHYEKSISYHRLMVELNSYTASMLERQGVAHPDDIKNAISSMYDFSLVYTKLNRYAPMAGDNDDGRFLPFIKRDFRDHAYLNDFNSLENRLTSVSCVSSFTASVCSNKTFCDDGFAVIQSDDAYLFVSNGEYSKFPKDTDMQISTHTHNDILSFELSLFGHDLIVDPGTYLYTSSPEDRNIFRSTSKHNTIVVDNEEQNVLSPNNVFLISRNSNSDKLRAQDTCIMGSYETIRGGMIHSRKLELRQGKLEILDSVNKVGKNHIGKIYFHFAEGVQPQIIEGAIKILFNDLYVSILCSHYTTIELIDDTVSPSFGILKKSKTAIFNFLFDDTIQIKTDIIWKERNSFE